MSHPPSKQDLEEVWNNSRIGWLKDYNKQSRGKTAYTVVARPYVKQYLDPVEITVFAKDQKKAVDAGSYKLSAKVREKYPYEQYKGLAWEYGIKKP